jgi:hypothetical protein
MANFNVSCPHCSQLIECDDRWVGQEIQCPACQGGLTVPAPSRPAPQAPPRTGPARVQASSAKASSSGTVGKVLKYVVFIGAFIAGFYFFSHFLMSTSKTHDSSSGDSGGGEVGHIAGLYDVLDKTDPSQGSGKGVPDDRIKIKKRTDPDRAEPDLSDHAAVQVAWNLDVEKAAIPETLLGGMLSGTNFEITAVNIVKVGKMQALSLRQGDTGTVEREAFIYFKLKPGEKLPGHKWTISKEMSETDLPKIVKRWKTNPDNPKAQFLQKAYTNGYAMKLEFGEIQGVTIPGKLYLALPDQEQSVVAGAFIARLGGG